MSWLSRLKLCPPCPPCPEPPAGGSRGDLDYAYYGTQDGDIPQLASHVTMVHIGSWGDWVSPIGRADLTNRIVGYGHAASVAGIPASVYTLDFCCFTQTNPRTLLPLAQMQTYLIQFADRLRDEGLLSQVKAFYVIDEPNIPENNLSASDVAGACAAIRDVFGHYVTPVPHLAIVYGWTSGSFPGISSVDWAGFDNYGADVLGSMYAHLKSQMDPTQRTIIVPGGSDPWRENPTPFYDFAQSHAEVAWIMPFKWFGSDGIGVNGMAPAYRAVGDAVLAGNP